MKIDFDRYFNKKYIFAETGIIGGLRVKMLADESLIQTTVRRMYLVRVTDAKNRPDITIALISIPDLSKIPIDIPVDINWMSTASKDFYIAKYHKNNEDIMYIKYMGKYNDASPMLGIFRKDRIFLFLATSPTDKEYRSSVMRALICFLRSKNLFALHTAYLTKNGVNILFSGESGCGKTTNSMNLIKAGFICRCDDMLFLSLSNPHVKAYPFPKRLLRTDLGQSKGIQIKSKDIHYYKTGSLPNFIIFPSIVKRKKSKLIPISRSEAMLKIVSNFTFSHIIDKENCCKDIELLKKLIQQCRCYSLLSGKDIRKSPSNLLRILKNTTGARI